MKKVKVLIFSGYGLNCEEETKFAFELAGASADIVHINDLIDGKKKLKDYQILAFPGGFSYGDDTGSGKAYANKVRNHLGKDLLKFVSEDKLVIGICNGFQILTNLGLLPGALTFNDGARYQDRWVDVKVENNESPWLRGITTLSLPIAHGEGKFIADQKTLKSLNQEKQIAVRYVKGEVAKYQDQTANPNGALEDIAGVLSYNGRVLGMMPHPERALFTTQLPQFSYLKEKAKREGKKLSKQGPGFQIFKNAVGYFK
ncbi:MAG: phosphoribosylformylglycinamidine synthase I [Candidatus Paceibacterota bacterium]|jgi:phosphoribosylformylglycinamidine synthase